VRRVSEKWEKLGAGNVKRDNSRTSPDYPSLSRPRRFWQFESATDRSEYR
jgi:hypothetical protein